MAHSGNNNIKPTVRKQASESTKNSGSNDEHEVDAGQERSDMVVHTQLLAAYQTGEEMHDTLGHDSVDALPESLRYNWFDFLCTLISIVTYIADLAMDCIVAYYFYHLAVDHGIYHYWYFGLTIFFIVLPSLTMTGFSFRWYVMDSDNPQLPKVGTTRWVLRLLVLFLQVAPILRYLDSMRFGLRSRYEKYKEERAVTPEERDKHRLERIKWYTLMVYEDADATLLRLYESFMESAPQLVLQIYILIKDPYANRINSTQLVEDEEVDPYLKLLILVLSVTSSLVSLAWSLVVYHRSLRYTYPNKKNISLTGTLFQFLWHFSSITARVLALSLFASIFPKLIGPLCLAHWVAMFTWVIYQRTAACNTPCEEFLFAMVLGAIYIFSFFNAKEERTRYKYLLYFAFSFVENSALLAVWFWRVEKTAWYIFPALIGHYLAFFGGIMFMLVYYIWFHPTGIEMPLQFKWMQGGSAGGRGSVPRRRSCSTNHGEAYEEPEHQRMVVLNGGGLLSEPQRNDDDNNSIEPELQPLTSPSYEKLEASDPISDLEVKDPCGLALPLVEEPSDVASVAAGENLHQMEHARPQKLDVASGDGEEHPVTAREGQMPSEDTMDSPSVRDDSPIFLRVEPPPQTAGISAKSNTADDGRRKGAAMFDHPGVRRSVSVPPNTDAAAGEETGALVPAIASPQPHDFAPGVRKLKYMGQKSQDYAFYLEHKN